MKFDKDGRIIYFSKGAEEIFGYKAAEVLGKTSVETINPEFDSNGESHIEMMKNIFREPDKFISHENENQTKDGRKLWIRWFNKSVADQNGNQMFVLAIGEDITETKSRQISGLQVKSRE